MAAAVRIASTGVATAVMTWPAQAASWNAVPQVRVGADYNDNLQLAPIDRQSTEVANADLAASIKRTSDWLEWSIDPRLFMARYKTYSVNDRTDQYLSTTARHVSQRADLSTNLSWVHDTTLTSELGSTGLTQANRPHESLSLAGTQTWNQSERWSVTTQLSGNRNHYLHAGGTGLIDYDYVSGIFQTGYVLSSSATISLVLSQGRLRIPDLLSLGKTNQAAELSLTGAIDELWTASLALGPSQIKAASGTDYGVVYQLSATRQGELVNVHMEVSQNVTPTGQGILSKRQQWSLNVDWSVTQRFIVAATVNQVHNRDVLSSFDFEFNQVNYLDLNATASWRMAPQWTVALAAGRAQQRVGGDTARLAIGNHAGLSVQWSGLPHTF